MAIFTKTQIRIASIPAVLSLFILFNSAHAQNTIVFPLGTTPVLDGIVGATEWSDADSVMLTTSAGPCKVLFKHDCTNLHAAFLGPLESANANFPEILIDVNNDKSTIWVTDDWWFHVSATDCYYVGAYGNYTNCALIHLDWTGIPNISTGLPMTDTIEIQIPLTTTGIVSTSDTIGISFLLTNTFSSWNHWPAGANRNSPATWGNAILDGCVNDVAEQSENDISVFPNPVNDRLNINFKSVQTSFTTITNSMGRLVYESTNTIEKAEIDFSGFVSGVYFLRIVIGDEVRILKVIRE